MKHEPGQFLRIAATADAAPALARARDVLQEGGLLVVPTETVYGCIGDLANPSAVERLRKIRGAGRRALTLHVGSAEQALPFIDPPDLYLARIFRQLWPGPVAVVVRVSHGRQHECASRGLDAADLYSDGLISLRCPAHALTRQILLAAGTPVGGIAVPGEIASVTDLPREIAGGTDLIIDGGPTPLGRRSTVIHVTRDHFDITRAGVYDRRIIDKMLHTTILFVCSGNTCRSPMAEGIARKVIAESLKLPESELGKSGFTVLSAGVGALPGSPAAQYAVTAVREHGGDVSQHRSRPLTRQLIDQASVIFAMGRSHLEAIRAINPSAMGKVRLLDPRGDIADPIGGDFALYKSLAKTLKVLIEQRLADESLYRPEK